MSSSRNTPACSPLPQPAIESTDPAQRAAAPEKTAAGRIHTVQTLRRYDPFSRALSPEEEAVLCTQWAELLRTPIRPSQVRYWAHRINHIEMLCAGRLAGDLCDAVLRVLVAAAVPGDALEILEIGSLFGVNAAVLHDVGSCLFNRVRMLLIDPLDGYYGPGTSDPATGLPVSQKILRRNFQTLGIPEAEAEIVAERSASPSAVAKAQERTFNFMFIDGDHSYAGVKNDFELYHARLASAGYLVFDNYRDGTCPGVDQFVDELRERNAAYQCLGAVWRSVVFRKR